MARQQARVVYVNEGDHDDAELDIEVRAVALGEDGTLRLETPTGSRTIPASAWGAFSIVRVPSAAKRL